MMGSLSNFLEKGTSDMSSKKIILTISLAFFLAGCAGKFTLIDRSTGDTFGGTTDGSTVSGNGGVVLKIEEEDYRGTWIYQASGGSFSFGSFASSTNMMGSGSSLGPKGFASGQFSGTGVSNGTASAFGVSAVGNGMINAKAQSGRFVRCVFSFNTMNNTGMGECLRNDGRTYDLNVRR
jgi:hypothetical protein